MTILQAWLGLAFAAIAIVGLGAQSPDHDAAAAASRKFAAAFKSCDTPGIAAMVTDDMQFIHVDGRIQGKTELTAEVAGCALSDLRLNITRVRTYGEAAIVQGTYDVTTKDGRVHKLLISEVFVRRNGSWFFASHQSTAAPLPR
jgi:ketosteroid isomerase-like protein